MHCPEAIAPGTQSLTATPLTPNKFFSHRMLSGLMSACSTPQLRRWYSDTSICCAYTRTCGGGEGARQGPRR